MDSIVSTSLSVQGANAIQKSVETIDVRGRAIHVTLPQSIGSVTGYHLFIVYTDKQGKQFICQGLPFDPATGKIASDEILPSDPPGLLIKGQCSTNVIFFLQWRHFLFLFTDKIFQLLVPLPKLGEFDQKDYFNYILLNKPQDKDTNFIDNELKALNDPNEIISRVNKGIGDPRQDKLLRERTVLKLDQKEMQAKTKHFLLPFVMYLEPNPRSIIRYVNIFNIVRAVNVLSATKIDNEKLALWLIVALRWPVLARHLQSNPEHIDYVGKTLDVEKNPVIPLQIQPLFKNADLNMIINNNDLKVKIDKNTIKNIILWPL